MKLLYFIWILGVGICTYVLFLPASLFASYRFQDFRAHPPIHVYASPSLSPRGMTPSVIKKAYGLPADGGSGTIAIIGAYNDSAIEKDLQVFDMQFGLPECTSKNGCFEKHLMATGTGSSGGWSLETSLDVEWAHAIAPRARILLIEASTQSGTNLMKAIEYARYRKDVVSVSMSWGGPEFADETSLDGHFSSDHGITFFASSGDTGAGASWPAVSPNVVAVGGTSLFIKNGNVTSEQAWSGSGGGVSAYEDQPAFQAAYSIPRAHGMRAIPDVSYDADPATGFSVYRSIGTSKSNWYVVGGTSAGAPQWAAIKALGMSADSVKFYGDKSSQSPGSYFRDIVTGSNGDCSYYCDARKRYDYVTGLGSPLTSKF